ncbi:MAG: hypothetical protein Q7R95_04945, partial [bacterium]|nr:hypothetical protein [bacterium]
TGLFSYCLFVWQIIHCLKKIKNKYTQIGLIASFISILFMSLFYYQTENMLLIFWIIAGISFSINTEKHNISLSKKNIIRFITIFVGVFISTYAIFSIISETITTLTISELPVKIAYYLNPFDQTNALQLSHVYQNIAKEQLYVDPIKANIYLEKAINVLKINVHLFPLYRENYYSLAMTYYWAGLNVNEKYHFNAISVFTTLSKIDPFNYYFTDQIGLAYLALGQLDQALLHFYHTKILDPDYPGVYLHIGEALKQKGKFQDAMYNYNKALMLQPNSSIANTQIKLLNNLIEKNQQINTY